MNPFLGSAISRELSRQLRSERFAPILEKLKESTVAAGGEAFDGKASKSERLTKGVEGVKAAGKGALEFAKDQWERSSWLHDRLSHARNKFGRGGFRKYLHGLKGGLSGDEWERLRRQYFNERDRRRRS
jgi:hypothetical protein